MRIKCAPLVLRGKPRNKAIVHILQNEPLLIMSASGLSLWLDQAEHTVNEAAGVVSICAFLSGTIEQTITVRLTTSERTAKGYCI